MVKKIKKRIKAKDCYNQIYSVTCPHKGEEDWCVPLRFIGDNGLPVIEYCKEVCLLKCGEQSTIQRIDT
jgi:hypothetical protein